MKAFREAAKLFATLSLDGAFGKKVNELGVLFAEGYLREKKVLVAGNGGSASDAQHFAAELMGRFSRWRRPGIPAIALSADSTFITAWTNDEEYESVFSRQIEALGNRFDIFVGITTSGNSSNIIRGFLTAKAHGLRTVALLGNHGGRLMRECAGAVDYSLIVPSSTTARIQEAHILILHALCERIEEEVRVRVPVCS